MPGPERNSYFCFPESPDVSRDEVEGNIRTGEKTKLTGFQKDLTFSVFFYISIDFFVPVFLFALLCSFFRLKELSQVKNGLTTS